MRAWIAVGACLLMVSCARATPPIGIARSGSASPTTIVSASAATTSPQQTPTYPATPSASASPTPSGTRRLNESDSGTTITVRIGQDIEVSLGAEYQPPLSSSDRLMRTSSTGGYPSGQPVKAVFRAVRVGDTELSSSTDYACLHSTPRCGIAQRLWTVHVIVKS